MPRTLLGFAALAVFALTCRADQTTSNPETLIRLSVPPAPAPKPALRYVLLPELKEMNPGNPIQNYFKFGVFDPFREYIKRLDTLFEELQSAIDSEIPKRLENAEANGLDPSRRGATWTYITTDQPFGIAMQTALRALVKRRTTATGQ